MFVKVFKTFAEGLGPDLNIAAKASSVTGCGMLIVMEIGRWREKKLAAAISVKCISSQLPGGRSNTYERGQYGVCWVHWEDSAWPYSQG